jgi:hypothetical protein
MFAEFAKEKGEHYMFDLCTEKTLSDPITFSPFNVRGNIKELDVISLLRMVSHFSHNLTKIGRRFYRLLATTANDKKEQNCKSFLLVLIV